MRPSRRTSAAAFFGDLPDPDDPLLGFAPYLHTAPRRNSITPDRQRAFVAALAASGIVTQAAREIGASLEALYKLRNRKGAEGFAAAWDSAVDRGMVRLQDCALERAIQGEERPVASQGRVVATYTRYDTGLMQFLLRQRMGERYGAGGGSGSADGRGDPKPGSPLYERIVAHYHASFDVADVRASINEKLEQLRRQVEARCAFDEAEKERLGAEELAAYCGA